MDRKRLCALLAGALFLVAPAATTGADRPRQNTAAAIHPPRAAAKVPGRAPKRHRLPHIRMTEHDWLRVERARENARKAAQAIVTSFVNGALDPDNWGGPLLPVGEHQHTPRPERIEHHESKGRSK